MATYEDIKKANDTIRTTEIKGKDYAEVNQRIKAFRMVYPQGFIKTELVSLENGVCVIKATVGVGETMILGTGYAYEKEGSTFINKTSYIENCETSAVGRALGMAGFGIDVSVASAEEVQNAIINQTRDEKITKVQLKAVKSAITKNPEKMTEEGICKYFKIEKLEDMTVDNLNTFTQMINGGKG